MSALTFPLLPLEISSPSPPLFFLPSPGHFSYLLEGSPWHYLAPLPLLSRVLSLPFVLASSPACKHGTVLCPACSTTSLSYHPSGSGHPRSLHCLYCWTVTYPFFKKKKTFIYLFIYWLCWISIAASGLSLVVASGGYSSLWCAGFSSQWLLLLRITGSRHTGFSSCGWRALEHRLSSHGAQA